MSTRQIDPHIVGKLMLQVQRGVLGVPCAGDALFTRDGQFAFAILRVHWVCELGLEDVYEVVCMAVSVAHVGAVRSRWYC
jgi:hypothetical protein